MPDVAVNFGLLLQCWQTCGIEKTLKNFVGKIAQLFEQKHSRHEIPAVLAAYRLRWLRWVMAGFSADTRWSIVIDFLDGDEGSLNLIDRVLKH